MAAASAGVTAWNIFSLLSADTSGPAAHSPMQPTPFDLAAALQAALLHFALQLRLHVLGVGGKAAGGHADLDDVIVAAVALFGLGRDIGQIVLIHRCSSTTSDSGSLPT